MMTIPTVKSDWLDLRTTGALRYRTLDWGGSGKLVLFIHGGSLCAATWGPVIARLSGVHAIGYDQRGHGDTDAPDLTGDYAWSLFGSDFLRVLTAVQEQYGRAPDAIVTHSFAGDCALIALAETGTSTSRLILLDPVLADAEGATTGAARLAKGTRRLGEKEAEGFESSEAVGAALERVLRAQLVREGLDADAKSAFATFGSAPDPSGRWRLKCRRNNEAEVYVARVALADFLADKEVDADVQLVFSQKRRARPEDQAAATVRDREEAERVVSRCRTGQVHTLQGVGHFLVLEAPELVAGEILRLL
jgi:pimeloyl-ACP methyl ester carboxylesterase